jgi:dimethylargininase
VTTVAITHAPSPDLGRCQLTYLGRVPIDVGLAGRQHAAYRAALAACGCDVVVLETNLAHPDCCFVEDTAVVLDDMAVLTPLGTAARAAESAGIEPALKRYRGVVRVNAPATLEGGDVLRIGRTLYVGTSGRTNAAGVEALRRAVESSGYRVEPVAVTGCLHLKTAVTTLPDGAILVNPAWLPADAFPGVERVVAAEPFGANVVCVNGCVIAAAAHAETNDRLRRRGLIVREVDVSEFAKAEGGVTCLSLLIPAVGGGRTG